MHYLILLQPVHPLYYRPTTVPGGKKKTSVQAADAGRIVCKNTMGAIIFNNIAGFINLIIQAALLLFGVYMFVGLVKNKAPLSNATGSTLFFGILAVAFLIIWTMYYPYYPTMGSSFGVQISALSIGIPGAATFAGISFMNLALMWLQVAAGSKSLKKTGSNLGKKPLVFVVVFSVLFGLIEIIAFAIIDNKTMGSAAALVFIIGIMIAYLVGSQQLADALEGNKKPGAKRSPRIMKIVSTGRNVAYCLMGFVVANVVYAVTSVFKSWMKGTDDEPRRSTAMLYLNMISIPCLIFAINVGVIYEFKYLRSSTAKARGIKIQDKAFTATATSSTTTSGD